MPSENDNPRRKLSGPDIALKPIAVCGDHLLTYSLSAPIPLRLFGEL